MEIGKVSAFVLSAFLGFVFCLLFADLACRFGLLFSGLEFIFTVIISTSICVIVIAATFAFWNRKKIKFSLRFLLIESLFVSMLIIFPSSWLQTRNQLKIFIGSVPAGIHVHQGRSILFSAFVHFSAPPEVISAIIQSHHLNSRSPIQKDQDKEDAEREVSREEQRSKDSWDWWQPASMSNPKFFYLHHESQAAQGWSEGWWVNDATNEVYAFISG